MKFGFLSLGIRASELNMPLTKQKTYQHMFHNNFYPAGIFKQNEKKKSMIKQYDAFGKLMLQSKATAIRLVVIDENFQKPGN